MTKKTTMEEIYENAFDPNLLEAWNGSTTIKLQDIILLQLVIELKKLNSSLDEIVLK